MKNLTRLPRRPTQKPPQTDQHLNQDKQAQPECHSNRPRLKVLLIGEGQRLNQGRPQQGRC